MMTAAIATAFSFAWPSIAAARSIGSANTPGPGHATKSGFEWADSNSFLQRAMLTRGGGIEGKLMADLQPETLVAMDRRAQADDEETATVRYIAANVSTQLMLKVIVEIISTMTSDPDGYRSALKKKLLKLADAVPLAPMPATQEAKVRGLMRESLETLLSNANSR
jgi:hypothetical protein